MRIRNTRLRTKIAALLLSLTALWAFAAWVTLREGVNLLWVSTLDRAIAQPTDPLLAELQTERRLSVIRIAKPGAQQDRELREQRARTDRWRKTVVRQARGGNVERAADEVLERRIDEMLGLLNRLDEGRRAIDGGAWNRAQAIQLYSDVIESVFRVYDSLATLDDENFAERTRNLVELNRSWELLSQEDALLAGALTTGRLTAAEHSEFTQIVGTRRHAIEKAAVQLQNGDPIAHRQLTGSATLARVRGLEDVVMQRGLRGPRPPVTVEQWNAAAPPAIAELRQTIQRSGDRLVEDATPIAAGVIARLALAGGLGLIAVIASIVISITTARALVRQLERLRDAAWELANERLPGVVERLGHGERVDVAAEAPPLRFGDDEIGQVGKAFNAVQETAIRTAVEQAELRRSFRDMLLSLARRSQTLVHRQLTLLDAMERREMPDRDMEDLFRLDHLATRMRRNAENLIVLSGSTPARAWRRAVPMVDVVRAAVAEIEDYTRVTVLPFGPVGLAGRAVGDVTHLLAELIENAVSFSPPYTTVQVGGHPVASGYAIEIEDRGLGMTDEKLAEINHRIVDPPEFNISGSVQLGLYVVGRLAERYQVRVQLKRSAYGGTTAVVLIPHDLVVENVEDELSRRSDGVPALVTAPTAAPSGAVQSSAPAAPPAISAVPEPLTGAAPEPPSAPESLPAPVPLPVRQGSGRHARPVSEPVPPAGEPADEPQTADRPHSAGEPSPATAENSGSPMPENPHPVPETARTPGGLPMRVPQTNLVPQLRTEAPITAADEDAEEDEDLLRSPEEIRRIVGAYQSGTRRGRSDAAKAAPRTDRDDDGEPES
ncbi:sensor histidine kinase [Thermomonospora amylolytica]|uniref:sensor histidine kinase n=1 Tax=Thermomonospora amylolytica TaxID=1411117 RepID=UPI000E6BE3B8|nr:nitrate- and nitrite sensing domain-containing protein [Thermomonospora amylolytica]